MDKEPCRWKVPPKKRCAGGWGGPETLRPELHHLEMNLGDTQVLELYEKDAMSRSARDIFDFLSIGFNTQKMSRTSRQMEGRQMCYVLTTILKRIQSARTNACLRRWSERLSTISTPPAT